MGFFGASSNDSCFHQCKITANQLTPTTMAVRVISYTRFSSPKQARGDSYRRQTEMALRWCLAHGLELDTDLRLEDLGVSGFSGANARRGALRALQLMCLEQRLEPGTILLIEALDRLTRLPLPEAQELLLSLINNGLTIVTLTDGKVWNRETLVSLEAFMLSVLTLYRGFQESDQKSKRLRDTFREAREKESAQAFGSAPGWLTRDSKTSPWVIDEAKAAIVREVFELSAAGLGSKAIAKIANTKQWPVPTRLNVTDGRWHAQMPGQILRNRAVLGEHEHRIRTHEAHDEHWRGKGTGIVILDYYPRIVSDDLWYRSRASIDTRSVAKRRDSHGYNIWSGLLFCGHCGAPLQRKNEKKGNSKAQITCADRLAGITECPTFSASAMDATLLQQIYLKASDVLGSGKSQGNVEKLAVLETQHGEKRAESERIADAIARTGGTIDVLLKKLTEISEELQLLSSQIEALKQELALSDNDIAFEHEFLTHALSHLYTVSDESQIVRASLHLKIARLVDTIWVWGYDLAIVQFKDNVRLTVPLPVKRLPTRVKPDSKHHRPPKPKAENRPYFMQMFMGTLTIPPAQRRNVVTKYSKAN
jgi:DNA invertase Pin-like site-specific DNA recombinase